MLMRTSSPACRVAEPSERHDCWLKSATAGANSPLPTRWRAWLASHHRPANPAKSAQSVFGGPATNNSVTQSATSPTTPAEPTPGPPISTTAPALADTTTRTPHASWPAPGSTSSGSAGRQTAPTSPPATEPYKPCSRDGHKRPLDTGLLRGGHFATWFAHVTCVAVETSVPTSSAGAPLGATSAASSASTMYISTISNTSE